MKVIILALLIILTSCGRRPGLPGAEGAKGDAGQDGYSLVVDVVAQTVGSVDCNRTDIFQDKDRNGFYSSGDTYQNGFLTCDGAIGAQGVAGTNGQDGNDGADGEDGQDGEDGIDGINANTTYQILSIIDPCGPQHAQGYDEVILKLGNGQYLASFSDDANGKNTRFGILPNGNYVTTDGTGCHFSLPIL